MLFRSRRCARLEKEQVLDELARVLRRSAAPEVARRGDERAPGCDEAAGEERRRVRERHPDANRDVDAIAEEIDRLILEP